MRHTCLKKPARMIAGLLTGLLIAVVAVPLGAQPAPETSAGRGIGPVYDGTHEVTLNGTIEQVVTKHVVGSPAGMHLLVMGPEGVVDAHVGPFLSKATRDSLQAGSRIRVVGAMTTLRGKSYLLARVLTVNDRTITVRGSRGTLAPGDTGRTRNRNAKKSAVEVNGGAR
jgi:hypothetical protein